ncbi:MAG: ABC transporter ATP-binding protein [Micropruina sp.]|uniref:ABC transporter ATP-binding protein n=1 Tax=Micropruina sp. TaxID=2737536 RepID=UPI0039E61AE6
MGFGLRILGVAIRQQPWVFALAVLSSVVFGALTSLDAMALGWATDEVLLPAIARREVSSTGWLWAVLAVFLGIAIVRALGVFGRWLGAKVMQFRLQSEYRRRVATQYLRLPLRWHQTQPTGRLLSNVSTDVEAAWAPLSELPLAVGVLTMLIVAVVQMVLTDPLMALVGLLVFPLSALATVVHHARSTPLLARLQEVRAELSEIAHESFDGALVIKALGRGEQETERFADKAKELSEIGIRIGRLRALFDPVLEGISRAGILAVAIVGAVRASSGDVDAGDVVAVAYLLTVLAAPIRALGWLFGGLPTSVAGFERVQRVLRETAAMGYGDRQLSGRGAEGAALALAGVSFDYGRTPVLRGLDVAIPAGRSVAVVGETASGKSTLTLLLARLMDPDDGTIAIDGIDLRDLRRGALAEQVALVPQTAFLFDDTVRGNVALDADVSDSQIWAALRIAQAADFVAALPDGLDTELGERGGRLSGGQRQRIALARALVRKPRLLILDDATSALDPEVEARVLDAVRQATGGATVVLVAHRKATVAMVDEVLFLVDGRIADRGSHRDLLARNDAYADLVDAYDRRER